MNPKPSMLWLLTGLAVAGAGTSFTVQAAKQGQTPQQRKAAIQAIRATHRHFQATQPRTMAQGKATEVRMPDGTITARVPTELWNQLDVRPHAHGSVRLIERTADASAPASDQSEGLQDE